MTEVERISDPFKISFPKLGWEFDINPTAFTVFGIDIQWYGIIITVGLLLAMLYCFPKMKKFGLDVDRAIDAVIAGVIGGIVGARAYYVLMRWDQYAGDWKSILNSRNGGLAIYGGIIGAVIVGIVVCKIRKVKILPMLDIVSIGFLIGQGVGRWGNFVNQEAFGTNTNNIFGMTGGTIQQTIIDEAANLDGSMYQAGIQISENYAVHPCFLYESVWCILGFVVLALYSKHRKYDGQIALMYAAWYGAERFIVEGLRTDSLMLGNIRASQALSAILVIVSIIIQIVMMSKVRRDPEKFVLYCDTADSKVLLAEAENRRIKQDNEKTTDDASADKDNTVAESEDKTTTLETGSLNQIESNQEDEGNGKDN